ncbi:MAG: cellobiose phosphorylase, partial [Candidatus Omnitrophota bacterium]
SSGKKKQVFYLYLRKHGDLERDYNNFHIQPTYFSQGNGNFRDIVQNRRSDIWFNPEIEDSNLITFLNLIQTDGFNPLIVKGLQFHLKDKDDFRNICSAFVDSGDADKLLALLDKPFTPGSVISFIEENNLSLKTTGDEFLNTLMINSIKEEDAQHKQPDDHGAGGFWTDHWTYCMDLLESYLELYPEKLPEILFDKKEFKFFDNVFVVRPRIQRYVIYEGRVRQLEAVEFDGAKAQMQSQRPNQAHWTRTDYGKGRIYQTTLITKLLCILVNKLTSLDPFGCGIEMEANKPNWYDALNGLPALLGSSVCETMELKRLIVFLKESLAKNENIKQISLFEDLYDFLTRLYELLTNQNDEFAFWDKGHALKEAYRRKSRPGVSAEEPEIDRALLLKFLDRALNKVECGVNKAFDSKSNLYCAYFINEVNEYEIKDGVIYPGKFCQRKLPLFLEAQVHALKIEKDRSSLLNIYEAVKKSELYDKKLKMYKVTGNLSDAPYEIGRCRAFSRGWLENESIWLHMEYKYLLEILEAGLYDEFYSEFKNVLICFQKPEQYGRSILENSSFLASSAFPDKNLSGGGFVARLSGSTAEFVHIWRIINVGRNPFFINGKGELNLKFSPVLAGWLFRKDGTYGFNFLSSIKLTYRNPGRRNTFGKKAVAVKRVSFKDKNGNDVQIQSDIIPAPYAGQIRSRLIFQIDLFLD